MSVNDRASNHFASRSSVLGRREFLYGLGQGVGSVALSSMLLQDQHLSAAEPADPLQVKSPHRTPRAKSVIFLVMYGGPSQMDTFDPKPVLQR